MRALMLVAVLAIVGCKDKKKPEAKPAGGTGSAVVEKPGDTPPATPSSPSAAGAITKNPDVAKLSVDTELVAYMDWQKIRNSDVYKKLEAKLEIEKDVEKWKKECGFDPRDVIKTFTFGASNFEGELRDKTEATIIFHGVDKKALVACYEKHEARIEKEEDRLEITRDGDLWLVKEKNRERNGGLMFTKDDELLVHIGGNVDKAKMLKVAAGGSGPAAPEFGALMDTIGAGATFYLVMNSNSKLLAKSQDFGINAKAGVVQMTISDGISGDVRIRVGSPDEAKKLADGFQGQIQAIAGFVDKIELKADGPDLHATAAASLAKLEAAMRTVFGGK